MVACTPVVLSALMAFANELSVAAAGIIVWGTPPTVSVKLVAELRFWVTGSVTVRPEVLTALENAPALPTVTVYVPGNASAPTLALRTVPSETDDQCRLPLLEAQLATLA